MKSPEAPGTESVAFDRAAETYDATRGFPPGVAERVAGAADEAARSRGCGTPPSCRTPHRDLTGRSKFEQALKSVIPEDIEAAPREGHKRPSSSRTRGWVRKTVGHADYTWRA